MNAATVETLPLITLVGPPNSGKTTLFNYLSGKNFKTVNYPGATVEYSICRLQSKFNLKANILDSPGIISLIPNSPDEEVAIGSLYEHPKLGTPDLLIVTADASQLSRHLFLVLQLLESGFKIILAVTMVDMLSKKGYQLSTDKLEKALGCDVVKIDGRTGNGVEQLLSTANRILINDGSTVKEAPSNNYRDITNEKLLNFYRMTEEIEQKVLYEIPGKQNSIDIDSANEQLNILTNPEAKKVCNAIDESTIKIDRLLLHKVWGLVFFFIIMSATFTSIFWVAQPVMNLTDSLFGWLSGVAFNYFGNNWFGDLIANGIISGTGSVMVFVPQILILFLILGLLEDTGYLARGAMLIDKPLSKIGLNGKSFVPMLSGFACAIPAMMAARTIPNRRERIMTIFILPLLSCSARLPVYALLIAFLVPPDKAWLGGIVLAAIYILSIVSSVSVAGILNKFKHRLVKEEDNSSFILELPAYRRPKLAVVLSNMMQSSKLYLKKAGPIILTFSIVLWFLTYFPNSTPKVDTSNKSYEQVLQTQKSERLSGSYAASMGKFIQPVMKPIGMDWRVGVSLISAFAAREVFVSSMALIFKVTDDSSDLQSSLLHAMRKAKIEDDGRYLFTPATITGLIVFFIFALQCLSTIAVSRKETGGWRIPLLQLITFTGTAYLLTFITVNGLRALGVA